MISKEQQADMAAQIVAGMLARPDSKPKGEYASGGIEYGSPEHYVAAAMAHVRAIIKEIEKMNIKVKKLYPDAQMPIYASEGAACFDLHAYKPDGAAGILSFLHPAVTIATGLAFEVPPGFCMLVFSRSGMGFRHNARLANCVGVIDSDFRGEVMVRLTLDNPTEDSRMWIEHGERIAQAMIVPAPQVTLREVLKLSDTERGMNGFGSTGR